MKNQDVGAATSMNHDLIPKIKDSEKFLYNSISSRGVHMMFTDMAGVHEAR